MIKACIFDLDGTLVDTLADIASMMNSFLTQRGWPVFSVDAYRFKVGRGLANLIREAVPEDQVSRVDEFYPLLLEAYSALGIGTSRPYPGVTDALRHLAASGVGLAVVSNKPDLITIDMMRTLFPDLSFAYVHGSRDGVPSKPDPTTALEAAAACGARPDECLFVGDTAIDMNTARAAGMKAVGAAWGFRGADELREAGADILIQSMDELPTLVSG